MKRSPSITILMFVCILIASIGFAAQDRTQPNALKASSDVPTLTEAQKNTLSETYISILENAQKMNAQGCNDLNVKQQTLSLQLQQFQSQYCPPVGGKLFHLEHTAPAKDKPAEWSCKETVTSPQPEKAAVPAAPGKK